MEKQRHGANSLKLKNLCLSRSGQLILNDLSLDLPEQKLTVLLGANGAGKSTLLHVLAGLASPDSGSVAAGAEVIRSLVPEPAVFYPYFSVAEQLAFVAGQAAVDTPSSMLEQVIADWQLAAVLNKKTRHLSLGYRQRLSLAQAVLLQPDCLLLDEPMNGMDPDLLVLFKQQIKQLKTQCTVVMATHIMHEAQSLADHVVVMYLGQVVGQCANRPGLSFHDYYQQCINACHEQQAEDSIA